MVGVSRRSWGRNKNALDTVNKFNDKYSDKYKVTTPYIAEDDFLTKLIDNKLK